MSHFLRPGDSFGGMLRRRRLELGLTLRTVCERIEVSPPYLSDIERDRRIPAESKLEKLSEVLGLDAEDVLAASGRLDDDFKSYLRKHPAFSRLISRVVQLNLGDDDLIKLLKQVEAMDGIYNRGISGGTPQIREEDESKVRR